MNSLKAIKKPIFLVAKRMRLGMFLIFVFFLGSFVPAQIRSDQDDRRKDDLPTSIRESIMKRQIEDAKKDFNEMLKRGEEAEKLSEEISISYEQSGRLTVEDEKKLERLERLIRKIQDELGVEADDEKEQQIESLKLAESFEALREATAKLASILKKSSRFTVSVAAVEISNSIIRIIRMIRFARNRFTKN